MSEKKEKPARKDKVIYVRVEEELHRKATARAKEQDRPLSQIVRSWLRLYAEGEAQPPVEDYLEREKKRAPKRQRKNKERHG